MVSTTKSEARSTYAGSTGSLIPRREADGGL